MEKKKKRVVEYNKYIYRPNAFPLLVHCHLSVLYPFNFIFFVFQLMFPGFLSENLQQWVQCGTNSLYPVLSYSAA